MKKILSLLTMVFLVMSIVPVVNAVSTSTGVGIDIETEDFEPLVWMCDGRLVFDDATEPGRVTGPGMPLSERISNYAFEGEQIQWNVLVMDKNGIEKVRDVYATIGDVQGEGNDIEVNCQRTSGPSKIPSSCNARILEEQITTFNPDLMDYYVCTLTVETSEGMPSGEYWVTVEAEDYDELLGTADENEYWYFNPMIGLSISDLLVFDDGVRPGTSSYSETLLVGNSADDGSGVLLDMFVSGTDFYDSQSSGAMCPTTNQLSLDSFSYYATSGAYSTQDDPRADPEGYVPIEYGLGFNDPNPFYGSNEIIHNSGQAPNSYHRGNMLAPGAEIAMTFRLDLPEPCNGDFDTGSIYFWGEAI